jgi:hypothetical protein
MDSMCSHIALSFCREKPRDNVFLNVAEDRFS